MKIDFNGEKMTISFDKIPKFLYFNEDGVGSGSAFIDGEQIKGIVDIVIHAHTKNDKDRPFLEVTTKQVLFRKNDTLRGG